MKHAILTTTIATVALGITSIFAYRTFFPAKDATKIPPSPILFQTASPVVTADDPKIGASNPKHVIIMYGDFQCEACAIMSTALKSMLGRNTNTQLVWKDAPNPIIHPWSPKAAAAGRCAHQQKKFWSMHDELFDASLPDEATIAKIADDLALDRAAFDACLSADATEKRIIAAAMLAESLGVDATPYFFVDGKPVGTPHEVSDIEALLR